MSLETLLEKRSSCRCELCSSEKGLSVFNTKLEQASTLNSLMVCQVCKKQMMGENALDLNHWRCLEDSMWSDYPAVQVMSYRLLSRLSFQPWAQDLLAQLEESLDEETLSWANENVGENSFNKTIYVKPDFLKK